MGTGYVRQAEVQIQPGLLAKSEDVNLELNAVQAAFHGTSGHAHDGTTGEGPKISLTASITGILPAANGGIGGIHRLNATTNPTVNEDANDGYVVGSWWINVTSDLAFLCVDATVGNAIWRSFQPLNANLTAIAGLTSAADKVPYFTGSGTAALADFPAYGRLIAGSTSESAFKAGVNLEIGVDVQAYAANLTGWAGVSVSDYSTTAEIAGDYQPLSSNLTAWAAVNPSAYSDTATISANYQPLATKLTNLGGMNSDAGLVVQTGTNSFAKRTLTGTSNEVTVTNGTGASNNPTISLPSSLTFTGKTVTGGTFSSGTFSGTFSGTWSGALTSSSVTITGGSITGITDLALADGGTGASLTDPNADRVMFWDDSASSVAWLATGTGLGISGTTLAVSSSVALLDTADQTVTGGARVTSLSLGTITTGTVTPDPGDRPMQHYTNNGAHTLAPGSNVGYYVLDITNGASAGAITTSGWTKVVGDPFTTTNGHKFRCSCSIGSAGSLLSVTALQ